MFVFFITTFASLDTDMIFRASYWAPTKPAE
jgi:hypothetical protein